MAQWGLLYLMVAFFLATGMTLIALAWSLDEQVDLIEITETLNESQQKQLDERQSKYVIMGSGGFVLLGIAMAFIFKIYRQITK